MRKCTLMDTSFNFNFTYTLHSRFFLNHKLNVVSNNVRPKLKKLALYSYINNVENFWNNRALGSFLLLFFVTGCIPFILRFRVFQTFKKTTYNAVIAINLRANNACNFLLGLSYHILEAASTLDRNIRLYSRNPGMFSFILSDWVTLKEITIHPAFFKWREDIFGRLEFYNGAQNYADFIMSLYRLNI